jgi:hypothetical protein
MCICRGRLWLIPQGEVAVVSDLPALEVEGADFNETQVGDYIVLTDARRLSAPNYGLLQNTSTPAW